MRVSCKAPLEPGILADYWLAELPSSSEDALEEHLFACEECSRTLQGIVALMESIRTLMRKGLLHVVVSESFLERLRNEGLQLRQYHVDPGRSVECTITDRDDLVIARLAANLTGVQRVDLAHCDAEGREQLRSRNIPLMSAGNDVSFTEPTDFLRTLGKTVIRIRLLAVEDDNERLVGEYTFNHTPSS